MLLNLHIVNLALIDELDIDFEDGLNILTGETGAGKSIIVGSIGIGLGGKFDQGLLRDDKKDGLVELLFSIDEKTKESLVSDEIADLDTGEILITRKLTNGRTVNRINGETVALGKLKTVAEKLINLHAQHEQRTLLKASNHLNLVDASDPAIAPLVANVAQTYHELMDVTETLERLSEDTKNKEKRIDFLRFEVDEIEKANLASGEDEEVEAQYKILSSASSIEEITASVHAITGYDDDESAGNSISRALRELQSLTRYDDREVVDEMVSSLTDIDSLINDFNRALSDYRDDTEFNEEAYRECERRLDQINGLKAKYGNSVDEILSSLSDMQEELDTLENFDEKLEELAAKKKSLTSDLEGLCTKLTAVRKKAAKALCASIKSAMQDLNFNDIRFDMEFKKKDNFTANGWDDAVFTISTNVGEPMKPLTEVASGGELSRVMLAIKSVAAESGATPTLIFDEIDVGISGITAQRVGKMMKKLSSTHQIISITHLAQIAAEADAGFVIEKKIIGDRTHTNISKLDEEGRVMELARLLGGENITEAVMQSARELMNG